MEQSGRRTSSPEGSDASYGSSASSINLIYPSPVLLSSVGPELGTLPTAIAHPVSLYFDEEPPDLTSSSGEDSDEYETYHLEQEHAAAAASSAARAAAVRVRKNIRRGFQRH